MLFFEDTDKSYEGLFEEGKYLAGYGKVKTTKGDIYIGDTINGQYEGSGTIICANGLRYEGEWREGKRHGQGKNSCQTEPIPR